MPRIVAFSGILPWLLAGALRAQEPTGFLTDIASVRNLSRAVATQSLPVKVQAVVTYDNPSRYGPMVAHDGTTGIFVALRNQTNDNIVADVPLELTHMPQGTLLEIEGVSGPGDYAPIIQATRIRAAGQAPLPPPLSRSIPELQTGRYDCQNIVVRGVTQTAVRNPASRQIDFDLVTELGPIVFHIEEDATLDLDRLVDAEVTVEGVCLMYFNRRNEQVGTHLQAGSMAAVTVHRPAPPDPFGAPRLDFSRLRPFSPHPRELHRTLITGTVTYVEPNQFLMLQNGDRAVRVNLQEHPLLRVGDLVDAAGFVEVREFYAELGNAVVRPAGKGEVVLPVEVTASRSWGLPRLLPSACPKTSMADSSLWKAASSPWNNAGKADNGSCWIPTAASSKPV